SCGQHPVDSWQSFRETLYAIDDYIAHIPVHARQIPGRFVVHGDAEDMHAPSFCLAQRRLCVLERIFIGVEIVQGTAISQQDQELDARRPGREPMHGMPDRSPVTVLHEGPETIDAAPDRRSIAFLEVLQYQKLNFAT